jgi:hypothetical protein
MLKVWERCKEITYPTTGILDSWLPKACRSVTSYVSVQGLTLHIPKTHSQSQVDKDDASETYVPLRDQATVFI